MDRPRRRSRQPLLAAVVGLALTIPGAGVHEAVDAAPGPLGGSASAPAADVDPAPVPATALAAGPQPSASERAAPPRTPTPATMPAAVPIGLHIESIGVDSELIDLGLQPDGSLEVPEEGFPAGWYTGGPTPGELGPAVIAGHVDWGGQPGVFSELRELAAGDDVVVTRGDGSAARFRVTHVEQFAKAAFPTLAVYGDLDHAGLRLITCGGSFDPQLRSYDDNLVVFAELVGHDAASPDLSGAVAR